MIRYSSWNGWRTFLRISNQVQASSSSAPVAAGLHPSPCSEPTKATEESGNEESSVEKSSTEISTSEGKISNDTIISKPLLKERRHSMVAAAFASLKGVDSTRTQSRSLDERITAADSVESLLANAEAPQMSRRHALRIVSQLADWTTKGRVKLSEFETDARFTKLCRILSRAVPRNAQNLVEKNPEGFGDLSVVLGITGDDEAAKLVSGASLSQMIRIMSSLAQKQRRSTPLLRSLAFNITRQEEKLNVKHCADLLYAMSTLNFPDELLLEKTCLDLCECVTANEKPAVIGSIFTSLGLLRYKNTEVLDALTSWVTSHVDVCRPQDLTAMLLTLSSVFYVPENANKFFEVVLPHMTIQDAPSQTAWLDAVWSLVVLERATSQHIASVLDPNFYKKLVNTDENQKISVASKLKLLNINAAAHLTIPEYKGALLPPDSDIRSVPLVRSRNKQLLLASIMDSFSNLLPSATYLRSNIDTGMGFLLDGECMLDSKCNPLPVADTATVSTNVHIEKKSSTSVQRKSTGISKTQKGIRIGIMAWDYRDMCRGIPEPNGVSVLSMRLLEKAGYKILSVPYTEYNPQEKLVRRVQYLDRHLKSLVMGS